MTLKDITPERFRCAIAAACPAVFDKGETLVIIGAWTDADEHPELEGCIGEGECAIEIDAQLVRGALGLAKDDKAAT